MIGRGLRHSHDTGKKDCLILDILSSVESTEIFGTPKLFGIDPAMKIESESSSGWDSTAVINLADLLLAL